ncbi:hypothetical protein [Helicobacter cetorum]|uniref:Uncharacterized protein n=1 Tax=Helicobacter cetorum (strain ATCC BAA-540 / CCUG 52418 / MIT 99-5656) TaxID=1163745 RepID=I0ERP5_HELCM|nr:hypothetical protein [Helicobacter cetorum]AFI05614.1 hypothetical protein HCD_02990 [Helicobacter cetorum MIT 99-5656]
MCKSNQLTLQNETIILKRSVNNKTYTASFKTKKEAQKVYNSMTKKHYLLQESCVGVSFMAHGNVIVEFLEQIQKRDNENNSTTDLSNIKLSKNNHQENMDLFLPDSDEEELKGGVFIRNEKSIYFYSQKRQKAYRLNEHNTEKNQLFKKIRIYNIKLKAEENGDILMVEGLDIEAVFYETAYLFFKKGDFIFFKKNRSELLTIDVKAKSVYSIDYEGLVTHDREKMAEAIIKTIQEEQATKEPAREITEQGKKLILKDSYYKSFIHRIDDEEKGHDLIIFGFDFKKQKIEIVLDRLTTSGEVYKTNLMNQDAIFSLLGIYTLQLNIFKHENTLKIELPQKAKEIYKEILRMQGQEINELLDKPFIFEKSIEG